MQGLSSPDRYSWSGNTFHLLPKSPEVASPPPSTAPALSLPSIASSLGLVHTESYHGLMCHLCQRTWDSITFTEPEVKEGNQPLGHLHRRRADGHSRPPTPSQEPLCCAALCLERQLFRSLQLDVDAGLWTLLCQSGELLWIKRACVAFVRVVPFPNFHLKSNRITHVTSFSTQLSRSSY